MGRDLVRKAAYDIKYEKENVRRIPLHINRKTDADILAFLESMSNRQGYIKSLIRKDMKDRGVL